MDKRMDSMRLSELVHSTSMAVGSALDDWQELVAETERARASETDLETQLKKANERIGMMRRLIGMMCLPGCSHEGESRLWKAEARAVFEAVEAFDKEE